MSEIFEALRKAQREANTRRAPQHGDSRPGAGETSPPTTVPSATASRANKPVTASRPRRLLSWIPRWLARANRNGAAGTPLLVLPRQQSSVGEQFRVLRTRVETVGRGTFMITSAVDQEGKTLCATNLAASLSMSIGGGVILVDADLRHPSIAQNFGIKQGAGLVDCLLGDASWQDCLQATEYPRLQVLAAGRRSSMSTELLASEAMFTLVADLKSHYPDHYVLVDGPPLLLAADPLVLARHVDHVILVVRADVTPRTAVMKAIETLGPERFLGIVLNGATHNFSQYYYYGRYPYGGTNES